MYGVTMDSFRNISIHPPREGWDDMDKQYKVASNVFQSTHPVRGGTTLQEPPNC